MAKAKAKVKTTLRSKTTIKSVATEKIVVGTSHRKELGDISGLATSIRERGLVYPVVIDKDYNLIAGLRRLRAVQKLGMQKIKAHFYEDLDEFSTIILKIEEQLGKKDLSWPEDVELKLQLHEAYRKEKKNRIRWTQTRTAGVLGMPIQTLSQEVRLAAYIRVFPELGELPTKTEAIKQMYASKERLLLEAKSKRLLAKKESEAESGTEESPDSSDTTPRTAQDATEPSDDRSGPLSSGGPSEAPEIDALDDPSEQGGTGTGMDERLLSLLEGFDVEEEDEVEDDDEVEEGDGVEEIEEGGPPHKLEPTELEPEFETLFTFDEHIQHIIEAADLRNENAVFTTPSKCKLALFHTPYSNALHYVQSQSIDLIVTDPRKHIHTHEDWKDLIDDLYRVLKYGSHMYLFISIDHYALIRSCLDFVGFDIHGIPLTWIRERGKVPENWAEHPLNIQSHFILARKPNDEGEFRGLSRLTTDVMRYPRKKPSDAGGVLEKPVEFMKRLINLSSSQGDLIMDPFAHTCNVLEAAALLHRQAICMESDGELFELGVGKIQTLLKLEEVGDGGDGGEEKE